MTCTKCLQSQASTCTSPLMMCSASDLLLQSRVLSQRMCIVDMYHQGCLAGPFEASTVPATVACCVVLLTGGSSGPRALHCPGVVLKRLTQQKCHPQLGWSSGICVLRGWQSSQQHQRPCLSSSHHSSKHRVNPMMQVPSSRTLSGMLGKVKTSQARSCHSSSQPLHSNTSRTQQEQTRLTWKVSGVSCCSMQVVAGHIRGV